MLLIITRSNCTFTPGYWQSSLKQADNGVTFFFTANRNSEISLSDSEWKPPPCFVLFVRIVVEIVASVEVILNCHLVTPGCSSPHTFLTGNTTPHWSSTSFLGNRVEVWVHESVLKSLFKAIAQIIAYTCSSYLVRSEAAGDYVSWWGCSHCGPLLTH